MKITEQIGRLRQLRLPPDQFVVVSSGAMAIHGIREAKDLDVIVTVGLWEKLSKEYPLTYNAYGHARIELPDDIEILNPHQSFYGNSKAVPFGALVSSATMIHGILFMDLRHLMLVKKEIGRPKDLEDIKLIEEYLARK